ncbi:hypothetical protein BDF22DRAFT_746321 [Syncephalis plumigaleata]|nr:hypothetical protein BDF22DRAFT_746321 [Syncephalis plumigaleata]
MRITSLSTILVVALLVTTTTINIEWKGDAAELTQRPSLPPCRAVRTRREIRTLTDEERNRFFAAIRRLQSGNRPTAYDRFVQTHYNARLTAHGWPWFLPWHRVLIREFERKLQEYDPSVMLPYWDWAYDSQAPEKAPVWQSTWFGGNGRVGDNCVTDGAFARWRPFYPQPHCIRRDWTGGRDILPAFYSPEMLSAIAERSAAYVDFYQQTESPPHNSVHSSIGSDMATMYSANDPIFWVHHAFVDKQWDDWQQLDLRNMRAYGGTNYDGTPALPSDRLLPFSYRVGDVFDTRNLCYTYAQFRAGIRLNVDQSPANTTSPTVLSSPTSTIVAVNNQTLVDPLDRTELLSIRVPHPIPEQWLRTNNANIPAVRATEAYLRDLAISINDIRNHVSPSVPINQLEKLSNFMNSTANTEDGQLTATRKGRQMVFSAAALKNMSTDEVTAQIQQLLDTQPPLAVSAQDNTGEPTLEGIIGVNAAKQLRDKYGL